MKTTTTKSSFSAFALLAALFFAGCGDSTTAATPSNAQVLFDTNGLTSGVNKTILTPTSAPTDFNDTAVLWYDINTTRNLCKGAETCRVGVDNEIILTIHDTSSIYDIADRYTLTIQKDLGCDYGCESYIVTVGNPGEATAMTNILTGNAAVIYAQPDYWLDRGEFGVGKIIE